MLGLILRSDASGIRILFEIMSDGLERELNVLRAVVADVSRWE